MMTVDAVGGIWRYALDLAHALTTHGVSTLLVGLGPRPSEKQMLEVSRIPGVEIHWTGLSLDWLAENPAETERASIALADLAQESGVRLIHFNLPSQRAFVSLAIPSVVVSHSCLSTWWMGVHPGEPLPDSWHWNHDQVADGLRRADVVVVPSVSHAAALEACYGYLPRLKVVLNGSSLLIPAVRKDDLVLSAGRWWDDAKNLAALDEATAACPWPVVLAGPLAGPGRCQRHARHVKPIGDLDRRGMGEWLARAEIFVSPSLYEPFGLAVLEAAQASCALVLSDIPTFRELWEGAALFVDAHSPCSISAAVNDLIAHPVRRGELAQAAWRRARQYTTGAQAEAMARIYGEAMEAAAPPMRSFAQ